MRNAAFLLLLAACRTPAPDAPARPNIVLIMADDLGYECVGANGGTSYRTPVLDRLAAEGMRFEHCYAQPLCTPSRVKLMTGISNVRNYVEFGLLDPAQTTFAQLLKEEGYATCVVGKWQLGGGMEGPRSFGFDEYCLWQLDRVPGRYPNGGLEIDGERVDFTGGEYCPDVVSDYACDFIERHAGEPFLVYYPMILTHCPFEPTPDSADWDPTSPGSPTYKGDPAYFGDMVAYMDKLVGKLLAKLEETGVRDDTLVVFLGDNGTDRPVVSEMNGRRVVGSKREMHDGGTRVPCIASWPAAIPAGRVSSEILDLSDFLPTLCELAGAEIPAGIDGKSLVPTLRGGTERHRDWIYVWFSRSGASDVARQFARNQRYKLYGDGRFLDVEQDVLEERPLDRSRLGDEEERVYEMLRGVIERYESQRPARLAAGGS